MESKKVRKHRSFGITISTAEPIEGLGQEAFLKWLKLQEYACAVIEGGEGKEEKRHLHGQVWYKEARETGTIRKALQRIVKTKFPESDLKVAVKVNIAFNDDFFEKYMQKDITEKLIDNPPPLQETIEVDKYGEFGEKETKLILRQEYYPSQEEQDKVMRKAHCADHKMNHLEELFYEWVGDEVEPTSNLQKKAQVSRFLSDMMYKSRKIRVPTDMKIQRNLCTVFTNYLWKTSNSFMLLSQEEQILLEQTIENNND